MEQARPQQHELRPRIEALLRQHPPSCLYADERSAGGDDRVGFAAFVLHVQAALQDSPRNLLLRELQRVLAGWWADAARAAELTELYGYIGKGVAAGALLLAVMDAWSELPLSKPERALKTMRSFAVVNQLEDVAFRARVKEGMRSGAVRKGRAEPTDAELEARLDVLHAEKEAKVAGQAGRKAALEAAVLTDTGAIRRRRALELWSSTGVQGLAEQYLQLDRKQGIGRSVRGTSFELAGQRQCFELARAALAKSHPQVFGGGAAAEEGEAEGKRWSMRVNCDWRGRQNQRLGEVDVAVLHDGVVCALVEQKSCCFEIAEGMAQHAESLRGATDGSDAVALVCQDELLRFTSGGSELLGRAFRESDSRPAVEIFVATLIPPHEYRVGASPALTKVLCEQMQKVMSSTTKSFNELSSDLGSSFSALAVQASAPDTDSPAGAPADRGKRDTLTELFDAVRITMLEKLKGGSTMSPLGTLLAAPERVLVLHDFEPPGAKVLLLLSGKRAAGKDFFMARLRALLEANERLERTGGVELAGVRLVCVALADGCKEGFAEYDGLDAQRLKSDRAYKEEHRSAMTAWYHEQPEDFFQRRVRSQLQAAEAAPGEVLVLVITDARRLTDMEFFVARNEVADAVLPLRLSASDEARYRRGWVFDAEKDWDVTETELDAYPFAAELTFENSADGAETLDAQIEAALLPKLTLAACTSTSASAKPAAASISPISAEQTLPIRHSVMWPDRDGSFVRLPEDETGQHCGAFADGARRWWP